MFCPERSLPGGRPFRMKRMSLLAGMPGGGIKHKVMVEVSAGKKRRMLPYPSGRAEEKAA